MGTSITVGELRRMPNAVGQVYTKGHHQFVVVATDSTSFTFMALNGRLLDVLRDVVDKSKPSQDNEPVSLEDREIFKERCSTRWEEIAKMYPAIDQVKRLSSTRPQGNIFQRFFNLIKRRM